jgi:hypothetical protein
MKTLQGELPNRRAQVHNPRTPRRKWKARLLSAMAALLWPLGLLAQHNALPQYREEPPFDLKAGLGTTGDWEAIITAAVEPHRELSDRGPSQSKICFVRSAPATTECAYFRDVFHSTRTFQVFASLTVVRLQSGSSATNGLVLKATRLYDIGQVPETAIWVYDAKGDDFHLVSALESGEVRICSSVPLNGMLVTADWLWDDGETRWSDNRRNISVYRYSGDGREASYQMLLKYTTTRKYGAEDTDTIDAELSNIEAKVQ